MINASKHKGSRDCSWNLHDVSCKPESEENIRIHFCGNENKVIHL